MVLSFTVSQRPKLACQKLPKQLLHTIQRVCIFAYVSLSAIAGAEGVSVEALMGKIGLMSCLNYFRIVFYRGWTGSTNWGLKLGSFIETQLASNPPHTQSCTYVHMHTCTHMLMTALTPSSSSPPPLELEVHWVTQFLAYRNCLLNERSLRLDGYSFS